MMSTYRSVLAKGRTELAFIRTGLGFITLGLSLMRFFGLGPWTFLDGTLVVLGIAATLFGLKGFVMTTRYARKFSDSLPQLVSDAQRYL